MKTQLDCILLVDDNLADNRYHEIIINELGIAKRIEIAENGLEAINFLKKAGSSPPELILLDINMPKMNGWEFLNAYKDLSPDQKSKVVIVMLTTSANPEDMKKAEEISEITGFYTKPLTDYILKEILESYF